MHSKAPVSARQLVADERAGLLARHARVRRRYEGILYGFRAIGGAC